MSAEMVNMPIDISALSAYTNLQRSSLYKTLAKMEKENLIELYTIDGDKKRKYVRGTKILMDQYINLLEQTKNLIDLTSKRLE